MELIFPNSNLLREILLRLPAECLLKFQSVCKEWLSLISSDEFRHQHTLRGLKLQQSLILQTDGLRRRRFHLNPTGRRMTSFGLISLPDKEHMLLQSCNGLLLLQPYRMRDKDEYLYVHNPATKKSRKIIMPTHPTTHPRVADAALAFDPSKSPYYQLVCVRRFWGMAVAYMIEVYSSESGTWNRISIRDNIHSMKLSSKRFALPKFMGMCFSYLLPDKVRVHWNNTVYWSSDSRPYYFSFDVAKRNMDALLFPASDNPKNQNVCYRLQESNGHLYHVELMESEEGGCEAVAVWELGEDHHWLLRQRRVFPAPREWEWEPPNILTFSADTWSVLICRDGWTRAYNLNTGRYEDFADAKGQPFFDTDSRACYLRAFQFGGTFALV